MLNSSKNAECKWCVPRKDGPASSFSSDNEYRWPLEVQDPVSGVTRLIFVQIMTQLVDLVHMGPARKPDGGWP